MTVCGIIAEYNPFHNGHQYHIKKSRQLSGADYVIIVLSGSFVQRGAPAFTDKYMRTRMALEGGADLVIELPALFSCASAEDFAGAGVSLLDQLGVVDVLSFGAESQNMEVLSAAARILVQEPADFSAVLARSLREGDSFPRARQKALEACFKAQSLPWTNQTTAELSSPNNLLALEYLKALDRRRSSIKPIAIPRKGADYHSRDFREPLCSASAIRTFLTSADGGSTCGDSSASGAPTGFRHEKGSFSDNNTADHPSAESSPVPEGMMPSHSARLLKEGWQRTCPMLADDFSPMLAYQLLAEQTQGYTRYLDVSEELSRRIAGFAGDYHTFTRWTELLKTKQYTYTRISRSLCHILLRIPQNTADRCRNYGYADYARVLGFRKDSAPLLTLIKKNGAIPMITKMADADAILSPMGKSVLQTELFSSRLYASVQRQKFPFSPRPHTDYTAPLIIV